jgi:hypothetical protein
MFPSPYPVTLFSSAVPAACFRELVASKSMTSGGRMKRNKKYEMQSGNYSGNRVHKKYKINEIKARELQARSTTIYVSTKTCR